MRLELLDDKTILTLEGTMDARACSSLHEKLTEALATNMPTCVHVQNVERIDTTCVQLLVSAKLSFSEAGVAFSIQEPSEKMIQQITSIGLEKYLNIDVGA